MSSTALRPTVADYLADRIAVSRRTQKEIAESCGFDKPNIITMFKQGKSKLPVGRVGKMARALDVDPIYLYALVMSEYEPETWATIASEVLRGPLLTRNEIEILQIVRSSSVPNPKVRTAEERKRVLDAINALRTA
jgi:hypothetical protein